jgi:hypothetical protein
VLFPQSTACPGRPPSGGSAVKTSEVKAAPSNARTEIVPAEPSSGEALLRTFDPFHERQLAPTRDRSEVLPHARPPFPEPGLLDRRARGKR